MENVIFLQFESNFFQFFSSVCFKALCFKVPQGEAKEIWTYIFILPSLLKRWFCISGYLLINFYSFQSPNFMD